MISREQYSDVDEHIAGLSDWNMDMVQLSPGQSKSSQLKVSVHNYSYVFYSYKLKSLQTAKLIRPGVSFLIPLSNAAINFLEEKFNSPVICCVPFGESVSTITPDNFSGVAVTISNKVLRQGIDDQSQTTDFLPESVGNTFYSLTSLQLEKLQSVLIEIGERLDSADDIDLEELHWLKTFSEERLMPLIFAIMANQSSRNRKLRPLVFRSALTMIHKNIDSPLSIAEISQKLGVSTRNLQYLFSHHLGMSPKTFIMSARLNVARKRLRYSRLGRGKVSDIANSLDFWHMGGFSKEFKKLFHQTPGDILRKEKELAIEAPNTVELNLID